MFFCFLPLLLSSQATTTRITYTTVAKPCDQVLADLSTITHLKLAANKAAASEMVLISVDSAPLQKLLDRIATVTSCKWEKAGEETRLVPDSSKRDQELRASIASSAQNFKSQIQGRLQVMHEMDLAQSKRAANANEPKADENDNGTVDADERATLQLLRETDPLTLASIALNERLVFATNNPTAAQSSLSSSAADIVSKWIQVHNQEVAQSADSMNSELQDQMSKEDKEDLRKSLAQVPIPAKAIITIERNSFRTLVVTARVFNAKGEVTLTGGALLQNTVFKAPNLNSPERSPQPPAGDPTPITFSDLSKQFLDEVQESAKGHIFRQLNPTLRSELVRPDGIDLLGLTPSDALLSMAKSKHKQIVADVPDGINQARIPRNQIRASTTIGQFEASCAQNKWMSFVSDGD